MPTNFKRNNKYIIFITFANFKFIHCFPFLFSVGEFLSTLRDIIEYLRAHKKFSDVFHFSSCDLFGSFWAIFHITFRDISMNFFIDLGPSY